MSVTPLQLRIDTSVTEPVRISVDVEVHRDDREDYTRFTAYVNGVCIGTVDLHGEKYYIFCPFPSCQNELKDAIAKLVQNAYTRELLPVQIELPRISIHKKNEGGVA
jgi:hypothetical protein